MTLFRTLFVFDILIAVAALYFFTTGLESGAVSQANMPTWFGVLLGIAAVIGTGYAFNARGQTGMASAVLGIVAAPALLYGLSALVAMVTQPG